jgi:hypothetical protein
MRRVFILGALAKIVLRAHYRYEIKPYAAARDHSFADVRGAAHKALDRILEEAWK